MYKPYGIISALVTPMNKDGSLCESAMRELVERQIKAGSHALFPLGTTGEFYALDYAEKIETIKTTADQNKRRVPLIVGTGCITTADSINLSRDAEKLGADALSVITPFFAAANAEQLYAHYAAIAAAVKIPVILYNIPARTGNSISPALMARLQKIPNIVGIKDSSGNFDNIMQYLELADSDFCVMSGNDSLILSTLQLGGTGAISGISNILPELMVSIYELWKKGDFEGAKKAQFSIRPLRNAIALGNPSSAVKLAVNLTGFCAGPARAPFDESGEKMEKAVLDAYNALLSAK